MHLRSSNESRQEYSKQQPSAFSLIEIIGVLAILAILAGAILPVLIRQIDYVAQGIERTNLVAMASGFAQASCAQRYIPNQNGWDSFIATNIGWQLGAVQTNSRHNPRAFLINQGLVLPYQQGIGGLGTPPANMQFMILSSMYNPLPAWSSSDFGALWNTPEDTPPTGTSLPYNGQGSDLKIQRINLASSFVHLVLNSSNTTSYYGIDNLGKTPMTKGLVDAYFLKGTVLNLYYNDGNSLQASQVLQQDSSWFFCNNLWRNTPCPIPFSDLEDVVYRFYTNSPNPYDPSKTPPTTVFSDMSNYMILYFQYSKDFQNPFMQAFVRQAAGTLQTNTASLIGY